MDKEKAMEKDDFSEEFRKEVLESRNLSFFLLQVLVNDLCRAGIYRRESPRIMEELYGKDWRNPTDIQSWYQFNLTCLKWIDKIERISKARRKARQRPARSQKKYKIL
jgi:hypothetical protein